MRVMSADLGGRSSDVQATFRLENAPEHGTRAVLFVNNTEAVRTSTTQPSVLLSGLSPGICELKVHVLHGDEVVASALTLFLISSAAVDPEGLGSLSGPDPTGDWKVAVAFGSDDWGRSADMIPIFPDQSELDRTEHEGWDPGRMSAISFRQIGMCTRCRSLAALCLIPAFHGVSLM
jgi:hypothetical protein